MKKIVVTAVLTAFGVGAMAFSAGSASAYVACNRAGECWHVDNRYHYHEPGIAMHPDDWYFHRDWDKDKDHHWRREEHRERGFYRNGVWITF